MISGCLISPHTSFTYKFITNDVPGTYFYHGHLGGMRAAGETQRNDAAFTVIIVLCTRFYRQNRLRMRKCVK